MTKKEINKLNVKKALEILSNYGLVDAINEGRYFDLTFENGEGGELTRSGWVAMHNARPMGKGFTEEEYVKRDKLEEFEHKMNDLIEEAWIAS